MARRLTRFASILGLFLLAYGIVWLAIWNPGAQSDLDSLLELGSPSQARLMIVAGALLLLTANIIRLIVRLASRKGSAEVSKR